MLHLAILAEANGVMTFTSGENQSLGKIDP